jgi:hypothetical protein
VIRALIAVVVALALQPASAPTHRADEAGAVLAAATSRLAVVPATDARATPSIPNTVFALVAPARDLFVVRREPFSPGSRPRLYLNELRLLL